MKKIGWIILWLLPLFVLNAASIFWLVAQVLDIEGASYWLLMTNKFIAKLAKQEQMYAWWKSFVVYVFMATGAFLSLGYIKFTIIQTLATRRAKMANCDKDKQRLEKEIKKIYK